MALTIAQAVKKILIREPFYGLFLMGLNKYFDSKAKTACVRRNGLSIEIAINKEYWDRLDDELEVNCLLHETLHIVYKHLWMSKSFQNKDRFNIAADCHVNSFLWKVAEDWYKPSDFGFENAKGTKFYYDNLPESIEDQYLPFDDHTWADFDNLSDAEKQLLDNQIDYQAKEAAEQVLKTRGNLPGNLKEYLDGLFKKKERLFNWKSYFRRMIGTVQDIELKKTRKRESIRFPNASGLKHKKRSNICVVVDTSGSVSNRELEDFFSEIHHAWKAGANITIIENDSTIQNITQYTGRWDGKVHGRGGTAFYDCVNWYNEHRRDFNTIVFFTDGYADVDLNIMSQSIWVISSEGLHQKYPGYTLYIPKENQWKTQSH